jgi:RND family efflux transporter MFP subunit
MRKKAIFTIGILLVIGAVAGVSLLAGNKPLPVRTVQVTEADIPQSIFINGKLESEHEVTVHPEVTGAVKRVYVKAGDTVQKGQLLFQLDTAELEEQLRKELNSMRITEQEQQKQRLANFEAFKKKQFEEGSSAAPDTSGKLDDGLFELRLQSHRLAIAELTGRVEKYVVKASEDGVVTEVRVKGGQSVAGGTPAILLTDPSRLQVRARLNELDANKVVPNMAAMVTGDAFGKSYAGKVRFVAPQASVALQAREQSVEVLVQLSETSPELKPGFSATVEIVLSGKTELVVPPTAVRQEGDQAYVYKIKDGVAVKSPVVLGIENEQHVAILQGLKEGDAVIDSVPAELSEGRRVTDS